METAIKDAVADVNDLVKTTPSKTISAQGKEPGHVLLTTTEAADYLRKSVSWLLRQPDVAYVPGKPNLYAQVDLDVWVERHKVRPRVRV